MTFYNNPKRGGSDVGICLFLPNRKQRDSGKLPKDASEDLQIIHEEKFLNKKACQAREQAAQRCDGVTIPEGI